MSKRLTEKQFELYRLIHPLLGGLTVKQAAKRLEIDTSSVYQTIKRVRKKIPDKLSFFDFDTKKYNQTKTLKYLYHKCKTFAKKYKLQFDMPIGDFYDTITACCYKCGGLPEHIGRMEETDETFRYNSYWHEDMTLPMSFLNTQPICFECRNAKKRSYYISKLKRSGRSK